MRRQCRGRYSSRCSSSSHSYIAVATTGQSMVQMASFGDLQTTLLSCSILTHCSVTRLNFKFVLSVTENRTFILLGEPPTGGVAVSSPINCVADGERPNHSKSAYRSALAATAYRSALAAIDCPRSSTTLVLCCTLPSPRIISTW